MSLFDRTPQTKQNKKAGTIVAIVAAIAAANGVFANLSVHRTGQRRGDIGSTTTLAVFALIVLAPVLAFLAVRMRSAQNNSESGSDDMNTTASSSASSAATDDPTEQDDADRKPLMLMLLGVIALMGILLAFLLWPKTAAAQGALDRGTLYIRSGADTLVTDHFARSGDTLRGRMQMKTGQSVAYSALLGPGNAIRTIAYDVYAIGAKDGDAPQTHLLFTMQGDTAIAETPAGIQRVATKPGAIPMMGNMLALTELYTRRARAAGGAADMPYLSMQGATIPVTVTPAGADSLVVKIGQQEQRFRVDAAGRILGGWIPGARLEFVRAGAETAGALKNTPSIASGAARDYSAPPGAPYTAENVTVPQPAGFTLGGTLTKPKNGSGRFPAVITITGSGQQDRDEFIPFAGGIRLYRELADTLSRRGIAVLRLDDRGLGESRGDFSKATTADFADDIRAAVAYLRTRPDIDPNRIALAGHSEGGIMAPMIAATDPKIRAIVILAGTSEKGIEISMGQNKYILDHTPGLSQAKRDSILANARVQLDPEKQTIPWLKFFMGYDPATALVKVKVPTLYIQGETDQQVPPAQAEMGAKLIRSNGNKDVTVRLFPATNHLFVADSTGDITKYDKLTSNKIRPEVLGAIADWLVLKLGVKQNDVRP
jgi:dienelactone hydrolase